MTHALIVTSLRARSFRNLAALELEPGPRFNVFSGTNGAGKTNLLEALDYAMRLSSFRGARDEDLLRDGAAEARLVLKTRAGKDPESTRIITLHRDRAREMSVDGKRPKSIAAWRATAQSLVFEPSESDLPVGAPDARRGFVDDILLQVDATYGSTLRAYERALRSRNALLREARIDQRAVRAFDEVLASAGAIVGSTRARAVGDLSPLAERAFVRIAGSEETIAIGYHARVPSDVALLRRALHDAYEKDCERGYTTVGPHVDDMTVRLVESPARHRASTGQRRAIVIALKVAALEMIERHAKRTPVFFLDDVSSELDRPRSKRLYELLSELGGQVFLTTTHPDHVLIDEGRTDFRIEEGRITSE